MLDIEQDIHSISFYWFLIRVYMVSYSFQPFKGQIREVLGGEPADKVTKQYISKFNWINIYILFVLTNLYFWNNYL